MHKNSRKLELFLWSVWDIFKTLSYFACENPWVISRSVKKKKPEIIMFHLAFLWFNQYRNNVTTIMVGIVKTVCQPKRRSNQCKAKITRENDSRPRKHHISVLWNCRKGACDEGRAILYASCPSAILTPPNVLIITTVIDSGISR